MISRGPDGAPPGASSPPVLLLALFLLFLLAGCDAAGSQNAGDGEANAPDEPSPVEVDLRPVDGSGTTGTVAFVPGAGGGSEVELSLRGVPDPGIVYVGAVYNGRCPQGASQGASQGADEQGGLPGADTGYFFVHGDHGSSDDDENVVQTLTSVEPGPDGEGASTTPLPTPAARMLSGEPKYVDVHGDGGGAVACADLPTREGPST